MGRSLRRSLTRHFAVAAALPIVALGALSAVQVRRDATAQIGTKNLALSRSILGEVRGFLREPSLVLRQADEIVASLPSADARAVDRILDASVRSSHLFESIYLLGPDGRVESVGLPDRLAPQREDYLGLDLSRQPVFRHAHSQRSAAWSETFRSLVTGDLSVTLGMPLGDRVLIGSFSIERLRAVTDRFRTDRLISTLLVDRRGTLLFDSSASSVSADPHIGITTPVREGLRGREGTFRYEWNGTDSLGSVAAVPETGWLVVVSQSVADATAAARRLEALYGTGVLLAVGLSILIAEWKSRRLARPLAALAAQANDMAEGNYGSFLPVQPYDEAEALAASLRTMAATVQQRQREIQASKERYEHLFNGGNDAVFVHRHSTEQREQFIEVNDVGCRRLGYSREELLRLSPLEIDAPEQAMDPAPAREALRAEGHALFETRHRAKNGALIPVEINAHLFSLDGQPTVLSVARDVTERKRAEEELRKAAETLQALIQSSPAAILATDGRGSLFLWNPAAERLFGWTAAEVLGGPLPDDPAEPGDERDTGRRRAAGEALVNQETRRPRKDGTFVDVSITTTVVRHDDGSLRAIFDIVSDISERKRAEEERRRLDAHLQQVQKLESLGVLAGGIAHDFNNLLMGVLGHADLALLALQPESPARYHLEQIEGAAQRAAELAGQMLAYSGKGRFMSEHIHLSRLVDEMAHLLATVISKKAALRYDLSDDLPLIEGDPTQIRQIVMNLIVNASDALGDRGGAIRVHTGVTRADRAYLSETYLDEELAEGRYVFLEVADTGCGMDEPTRAKIFDPFFTTKFTGRGLGLAAALGIVRGHRGAIKIYSEPGQGTTFKVLFPCPALPGEVAHSRTAARTSEVEELAGRTVLLVDDDEAVRRVGKLMLERAGMRVLTASDGDEGVRIFGERADEVAVVILDMTMPKLNGEDAFREIRRLRGDAPVILSSGYSEHDAVARFAGKGLAGFLQKPYRTGALVAKVQEALARRN